LADGEGGEQEGGRQGEKSLPGVCSHLAHILSVFADFTHLLKKCIQMHSSSDFLKLTSVEGKGKGHPCTGTEALYRPYGP